MTRPPGSTPPGLSPIGALFDQGLQYPLLRAANLSRRSNRFRKCVFWSVQKIWILVLDLILNRNSNEQQ